MNKFFLGLVVGVLLITGELAFVISHQPKQLGGVPSNGSMIGIYNATPITLDDGYGSALATDVNGKLIATSTNQ